MTSPIKAKKIAPSTKLEVDLDLERDLNIDKHRGRCPSFALIFSTAMLVLTINACDTDKSDGEQDDTAGTSGLALSTGEVDMNVVALSSDSSTSVEAANANNQGQPGSLAIETGLSLTQEHLALDLAASFPTDERIQISSGAPTGFKLTITKISFANSSNQSQGKGNLADASPGGDQSNSGNDAANDSANEKASQGEASGESILFASTEGVEIAIDSGVIDLSNLLSEADATSDAGLSSFKVNTGKYDTVNVTVKRGAMVKGCVKGTWSSISKYPGTHTYCTTAGKSLFDAGTVTNADFENTSVEWMLLDLNRSFGASPEGSSSESSNTSADKAKGYMANEEKDSELRLSFKLPPDFEVKEDESITVSMVFDMNRMLRFYNQGDQTATASSYEGANPSFPTSRPHFFTTIFEQSMYFFAGMPGKIYGYEMVTKGCKGLNQTAGCDGTLVSFWTTIITDPKGAPIMISSTADDDRDFTVISNNFHDLIRDYNSNGKDQNRDCTEIKAQHSSKETISIGDLFKTNSDGTVNYTYGLGCDLWGTIKGFPASLDAYAIGQQLPLMHFQLQNSATMKKQSGNDDYSGPVYAIRRL